MMRGEGLAGPLAATGLFPGAARQMFAVGENTGNLDDQLQAAANYLDRELDYKIKRFTALIEPAVIHQRRRGGRASWPSPWCRPCTASSTRSRSTRRDPAANPTPGSP